MRPFNTRELQKIELDILIAIDEFCRENNIRYSLFAGTMLGAVRHQGFIPWDDDADLYMIRNEYNKFIESVLKQGQFIDKQEKYWVCIPGMDGYRYPFIKVIDKRTTCQQKDTVKEDLGVWVDVFPIDYCGDKEQAVETAKRHVTLYNNFVEYYKRHHNDSLLNICKNVYLWFFRLMHAHAYEELMDNVRKVARNLPSEYCGVLAWISATTYIYPSEYFNEYIVGRFENHDFMMFKEYDKIMKIEYGDYMKLPPENERFSHEMKAYWKEGTHGN